MSAAKEIATGIAHQLVENGRSQLEQAKATIDSAAAAGERFADSEMAKSPTSLWQQVKSLPRTIKEYADHTVEYTVNVYDSVKGLGSACVKLGHNVSQVPTTLGGVDRFASQIAKSVDRYQEANQAKFEQINHLLGKK